MINLVDGLFLYVSKQTYWEEETHIVFFATQAREIKKMTAKILIATNKGFALIMLASENLKQYRHRPSQRYFR